MELEPNGEIGFSEPFSNLGCTIAFHIYDAVIECMFGEKNLNESWRDGFDFKGRLSVEGIDKLEFFVRLLAKEFREFRCGAIEMYFESRRRVK